MRRKAKITFIARLGAALEMANELSEVRLLFEIANQHHIDEISKWDNRRVKWSWISIYTKAKKKTRGAVIVMIEPISSKVVAACDVTVTKGRLYTKLHFVERSPEENTYAGEVLSEAVNLLETLSLIFKTRQICIDRPAPPLVIIYQQRYEFLPVRTRGQGPHKQVLEMAKISQKNLE